jgi:hypothetical protein
LFTRFGAQVSLAAALPFFNKWWRNELGDIVDCGLRI